MEIGNETFDETFNETYEVNRGVVRHKQGCKSINETSILS